MKVKALAHLLFKGVSYKAGTVFEAEDPEELIEYGFAEKVVEETKKPAPKKAAKK
jgi:hypothetical protein